MSIIKNMFFQLPEFQKMSRNVESLQANKATLQELVTQAYSPDQKVNKSLQQTIEYILTSALKDIDELKRIQNDVEGGSMIPENISVEELLYDRDHMPQWFEFVFQKEFQKQKKNFDVVAKKTYKMHGLREKKNDLELQAQSFRNLYERFQALSGKQKQVLDIMSEAESLKNKANLLKQRYQSFCQLIASKITNFFEQNCKKALTFHGQIQNYADKSSFGQPRSLINDRIEVNQYPTRSSFVQQRQFMKSSMPMTSTGFSNDRLRAPDSPSRTCLNHFAHHPSMRSIHERQFHERSVAGSSYGGFGVARPSLGGTGMNFRNTAPRWLNTTSSSQFY